MTTVRPRILVTVKDDLAAGRWDAYSADYARAVKAAGGEAIAFSRRTAPHTSFDGLVIIGGLDVDPAQYGETPHPQLGPTSPERDTAELALIRHALETDRPLFAICRGAQLLNVACGGSLLQHIEDQAPHRGPDDSDASAWHSVNVTPHTLLERIAGDGPLWVNSRHHQAVTPERLAPDLIEAGRTDEGGLVVIEAFEAPAHPFALGVQWHPERPEMRDDPARRAASTRLFDAFVQAAAKGRARRPA